MSRIIVAANKTLPRNGQQELDTGIFYVVEPLKKLGHEVYFYDTVAPEEPDFDEVVRRFNPDLIFCCFTGNPYITPYEPWESIQRITYKGKIKTFNWFCDDTWRFDTFSSKVCWLFSYCSTPEPSCMEKFREIGYDNILLGAWHANSQYYPSTEYPDKDIDLSFVGGINEERKKFFDKSGVSVTLAQGLDVEELFKFYCRSKIGINLSVNANDDQKKTQMKQRIFELAAANCVVLTEYHEGIEDFFEVGKEVVAFEGVRDFEEKIKHLRSNPIEAQEIADAGRRRFLRDHDSCVRLEKIVGVILDEA